ncbi:hydrogenase [Sulfurimonas sp. NWX79]|uniref:NADH-quinone oxidoreductase subunit B family protein n=1 Tax=Sulfurimonas sp. NWX79 TaxID=2925412 RepID=UPI0032046881
MNLYWLQSGGCSGDSMSLLNYEGNLFELFENIGLEVLWHPSLANISPKEHDTLLENILNDTKELDILCIEGNVVMGPDGSGMFDTFRGEPKYKLIEKLSQKASYIVAVGTCASFGGMGSYDEMQGLGLGYLHEKKGGFLGKEFLTKKGLPIINLPGCPIQPKALVTILQKIVTDTPIKLNKNSMDESYYNFTVHQGCTRNEYHEYKVEENDFGENGCMFFHLGCKGPTTMAPCNKYLWNEVNSKTRVGVPCFGCTRPDFPQQHPFFETQNIVGTPLELPKGVDRAHYLAYKDMAWAAAPKRLAKRKQRV